MITELEKKRTRDDSVVLVNNVLVDQPFSGIHRDEKTRAGP